MALSVKRSFYKMVRLDKHLHTIQYAYVHIKTVRVTIFIRLHFVYGTFVIYLRLEDIFAQFFYYMVVFFRSKPDDT